MDLTIYMEVADMAIDENGESCPAGLKVSCGTINMDIAYEKLAADFNIKAIADLTGIDSSRITIITPEQYQERYGDDDEDGDLDDDDDWGMDDDDREWDDDDDWGRDDDDEYF